MSNDLGKSILTRIKNNSVIYNKITNLLYKEDSIEIRDAEFLYTVALTLISEFEKKRQKQFLLDYAYLLIARTSFKINDFRALYDFTVNYGYYPISRHISQLGLIPTITINQIFSEISIEEFSDEGRTLTFEQDKIFRSVLLDEGNDVSFLAPTSYGKSELIFSHIKNHPANIVGIIVPTKALIDQFYREAKKRINDKKIIVHDQNYSESDEKILAIVTQERALRLIESGIIFDKLYIDEAHEMLDFDFGKKHNNRSLFLTRVIRLARVINKNCKFIYLSPVVNDSDNLRLKTQKGISEHKIFKDLKILDIKFLGTVEKRGRAIFQYDRYLGNFVKIGDQQNNFEYILNCSKEKNLHFLYRPKFIEQYAQDLYRTLPNMDTPESIEDLINELRDIVHEDFLLADYLSKGVVYLHGKIPSIIKNYILKFVRESYFIKHVVANSVILAGINLPIDNLFYISGFSKLRDLYNLFGRVNRLNEIFNPKNENLSKIFIPIHFVEFIEYPQNRNGSLQQKIEKLRSKFNDEVKNPLLENARIDNGNKKSAEEIQHDENKIVNNFEDPDFKQKLIVAGAQQLLNFTDSGLKKVEKNLKNTKKIRNSEEILDRIKVIFFDEFSDGDFSPAYNSKRLENQETINYYKMFLADLKRLNLRERIDKTVDFWRRQDNNYKIYVGSSFGEIVLDTVNYPEGDKVYVQIDDHKFDTIFLNNLAILKLQIDEDFLGHEISLLVNTLLKFEVIDQNLSDEFFYGTTDKKELEILQLGISRSVYNKLKEDDQIKNIRFDDFGNTKANKELLNYINKQRGILKFELEQYFV